MKPINKQEIASSLLVHQCRLYNFNLILMKCFSVSSALFFLMQSEELAMSMLHLVTVLDEGVLI